MVSVQVVLSWALLFLLARWLFTRFGSGPGATGGAGGAAGRPAAPRFTGTFAPHIVARINELAQAFPQVPRSAIEADVRRTGSLDATVENLLSGRLQAALTAQAAASAPAPATPASAPGTPAKPTTYAAVMSKIETPVKEPPKGWVADPDERQSILAQRKLFMLQQARSRYLARMARQAASEDAATPQAKATGGSAEAAVLASAESHESGAGLHRRTAATTH